MVLLEGSIHKLKIDFNKKIQELKVRKKEIIDRVKKLNVRLKDINGELGEDMQLFEPSIDEKIEYPEKFFEVNEQGELNMGFLSNIKLLCSKEVKVSGAIGQLAS